MNIRSAVFENVHNLVNLAKRMYCQPPKGIKYYGFTYYPRDEKFQDPPYEPSKLFLIKRIKTMHGRNPTERNCLALLNIDGKVRHSAHISIVKNIPSTNALLWKVKHLVEIKPITWKGELPKDFSGTFLRDSGELVISPKLKVNTDQIEATEKIFKSDRKPRRVYLKGYLRQKWQNGFTGTA